MKKSFFWKLAVWIGAFLTVANALGIFFAHGVYGLAGFALMALLGLAWMLQAMLENKPLRLANTIISILVFTYGAIVVGLKTAGYLQNMSVVGLCCAIADLFVGAAVLYLTLSRKES